MRGFETNLFLHPVPNSLGRILVNPHVKVIKGCLLAHKLNVEEAYEKFGNKPIANWSIPDEVIWMDKI